VSDLEDLQPSGSGTSVSYVTRAGTVAANSIGQARLRAARDAGRCAGRGVDFARQPADKFVK
jgi:hypothetical protein